MHISIHLFDPEFKYVITISEKSYVYVNIWLTKFTFNSRAIGPKNRPLCVEELVNISEYITYSFVLFNLHHITHEQEYKARELR